MTPLIAEILPAGVRLAEAFSHLRPAPLFPAEDALLPAGSCYSLARASRASAREATAGSTASSPA